MGVVDASFNTGAAIGPIIGGLIFDVSHSYFLAFSLAAAVMWVVTWLISLIRRETGKYFTGV